MITTMLERRASPENPSTSLANPAQWLFDALGGGKSASGVNVSPEGALGWTAVSAGVRLLSGLIASLPFKVYERLDRGKRPAPDHPVDRTIRWRANPEATAFEFWEMQVAHIIMFGVGYAEKVRDGAGRIRQLWPIHPDRVTPKRDADGQLFYRVTLPKHFRNRDGRRQHADLSPDELLRIPGFATDGLIGKSLLGLHKEAIGLGIATERFAAKFFSNSANPVGALQHPGELSAEAANRLRNNTEAIMGGLENAHRIAILEEGMEWKQVSTDPEKSQLLEGRRFQVDEAARVLNIPQHLLGNLDRATHSNVEEQNRAFLTYSLNPWLRRIEGRANVDLFDEREEGRFFAEHVTHELLRANAQGRGEFYQARFQTASITPNQIRELENDNPIEGGDEAFVQVNMVPLSQALSMSLEDRARLIEAQAPRVEAPGTPEPGPREARQDEDGDPGGLDRRRELLEDFLPLFVDAAQRMVRGEVRNVERLVSDLLDDGDIAGFTRETDRYYSEQHPDFMRQVLGPVISSLAIAVSRAAGEAVGEVPLREAVERFADEYNETLGDRYSMMSRRQLLGAVNEAREGEGEPAQVVRAELNEWENGTSQARPRGEQVADREAHQLENAVAKFTFVAAGVLQLRWSTRGEGCPLCDRLNGKVVGTQENFLASGDTLLGTDGETELTVDHNIGHPPAHRGCDCGVVPG